MREHLGCLPWWCRSAAGYSGSTVVGLTCNRYYVCAGGCSYTYKISICQNYYLLVVPRVETVLNGGLDPF